MSISNINCCPVPTQKPFSSITPTNTPTTTPTPFASVTPTNTNTPTNTSSTTSTPTLTRSVTPSITNTATPTITSSITPTVTITSSITNSISATSTLTPTPTITDSSTPTPTPTITETPTNTPTITLTPSITTTSTLTPTITPTNTLTPSNTPTITLSNSLTPTESPTPTITLSISLTPTETPTPTPTITLSNSLTVTPTQTLSNTATPTESPTPTITLTNSLTPTETPTPTITLSSSLTPTQTSTPTITLSNSLTPTESPTPTITLSNSLTPTETPTPTITPSNSLTPTQTPTSTMVPTTTPSQTPGDCCDWNGNGFISFGAACNDVVVPAVFTPSGTNYWQASGLMSCGDTFTASLSCNSSAPLYPCAGKWTGTLDIGCVTNLVLQTPDESCQCNPVYPPLFKFSGNAAGCNCCNVSCNDINYASKYIDWSQWVIIVGSLYINPEIDPINGYVGHSLNYYNQEHSCAGNRVVTATASFDKNWTACDHNGTPYGLVSHPLYDTAQVILGPEDDSNILTPLLRYCQWNVWITTDATGQPIVDHIVNGALYDCPSGTNTDYPSCCGVVGATCPQPPVVSFIHV